MRSMLKYYKGALLAAVLLLCGAREATAATSFLLYSGPDSSYPVVGSVYNNTNVQIYGCLSGWTWCDVAYGPYRGWIPGVNLWRPHGRRRVSIVEYGPRMGIPFVQFQQKIYWDNHYRDRPFYNQRTHWEHHGDDRYDRHEWHHDRSPHWNQ